MPKQKKLSNEEEQLKRTIPQVERRLAKLRRWAKELRSLIRAEEQHLKTGKEILAQFENDRFWESYIK